MESDKFGLPADALKKLGDLKKSLPEKTEEIKVEDKKIAEKKPEKSEKNPAEQVFLSNQETEKEKKPLPGKKKLFEFNSETAKLDKEINELEKKLEEAQKMADGEKVKIYQDFIDEKKLAIARLVEKETGEKFDLEAFTLGLDKTPEEAAKVIERIEGKKNELVRQPAEKKEGEKNQPKETASAKKKKPKYSEYYLLSALEDPLIKGDKKLEAYYKAQLSALSGENKKTTAEKPVIKKTMGIEQPKFGPEKPREETDLPRVGERQRVEAGNEQLTTGKAQEEKTAEKTVEQKPVEKVEKKEKKPRKKKPARTTDVVRSGGEAGEIEKEAKKAEKQVGKEGLFGKEAEEKARQNFSEKNLSGQEEEFPLGAEAAVRPMEGMEQPEKKRAKDRSDEEKAARAEEFKKYQEMKKDRADYADKAKDYYKYQTILGKLKKVFRGEEAGKVAEEFEAAREKYEKSAAAFNGEKLLRHNAEESRRVNEIIDARAKENSSFEKIRAGYKWLGDQNLEKVFKPESKVGKIICRAASLRTAVGLGLGATGFGLALSGGTAAAVGSALFLRKLYSGAASGLGSYEGMRMYAERKTAISDEQIKNLDMKSANEKMAQLESWAILNGKKITEYPDYVKIRDKRTELLVNQKSVKLSEAMGGQFLRLNNQIEKRNRGEMYRKAAALGMGVFVGSGAMAWTFKKALYGVGILHEAPAPGARPEIIPKGPDIIKEGYIETAGKGSSVWKMTEHQLQSHYGARFNGLSAAQKTYLIDYYKDMVVKNSRAFGLENVDVLKPGQKLNFMPLFTDNANFEKGIGKALKLTAAETQNILSNNKILREWVLSHPGERLTSARVEELLRMPKGSMAEHFANDNMIHKPSGVTVAEVIAEQEKIRTAGIVQEMGERATARILNNTIQESGLTFEEYRAIKVVSVKQLLEQAHWDNWKAGTVDLPHDGIYGGTEFARQVKLAEMIRSMNPTGGKLDMSVEDYLKGAINEGKFSSRGVIESAGGSAVPEGSPAEIEARPRGISPAEVETRPKGAAVLTEKQPAKIVEAAAETKGVGSVSGVELSTGEKLEFIYNSEGKVAGFSMNNVADFEGGRELLNDNWRETVLDHTKGMMNKQLYLNQVETEAGQIASYQKILDALPKNSQEASYLRGAINKMIENAEKRYGDIYK